MRLAFLLILAALLAAPVAAQNPRPSTQVDTTSTGTGLGPGVAADGNTIAIAYNDGSTGGSNTVNVVVAQDGRGLTWLGPVRVDQDGAAVRERKFTQFDGIAVVAKTTGDHVYVAWEDERNGASNEDLYFNYSTDGGATWVGEQWIDKGYAAGTGAVRDWRMVVSPEPGGGANDDVYFLISTDPTTAANEELYVNASHDGGATFGGAVAVSSNGLGAEDVDLLDMSAQGNTVHVAWQGDRVGGASLDSIFYQKSTDGGATWLGADVQLDSSGLGVGDADGDMTIAVAGNTVAVAWQEELASASEEELRVAVSSDGGATWSADVLVGGYTAGIHDVDYAEIGIADSAIAVAWDDNRSGSDDVYIASSTDGGVTWNETLVSMTGGGFPRFSLQYDGLDRKVNACVWTSVAFPNTTDCSFTVDDGVTWNQGITVSDNAGFDADFAEVAYNDFYGNVVCAWLSDDLGTNHVYAGGFRPQTITPNGPFTAGNQVNFDLDFFEPGGMPFGAVLISGAMGNLTINGRNTGLANDSIYKKAIGLIPGPLSTNLVAGSGSTPLLTFPSASKIPVGTDLFCVGVDFANKSTIGDFTDVFTVTDQ